ncbi:unnamed protein product [Vicia faba]|uniref:RNase H type-1 domain-containing protein n=1 Tax=Vicia faba TaxID=3906 RepID=A0AAV0YNZ5_VICFA|nr:unnamed protein product [Vicia faba]
MHNKIPTDDNLSLRGLSFPSIRNLCKSQCESSAYLFFDCLFVCNIWNWLKDMLGIQFDIRKVLSLNWSSQAETVVSASVGNVFFQVWKARNLSRFKDKNILWKSRVNYVAPNAEFVGNLTSKCSNAAIKKFILLKNFDITIHPSIVVRPADVVWSPPPIGWIKCNVNGIATVFAEFNAVKIAIKKAKELGWKKLWIKADCLLVVNSFSNPNLVPWILKARWDVLREFLLDKEAKSCFNNTVDQLKVVALEHEVSTMRIWFLHQVVDSRVVASEFFNLDEEE